MAEIELIVRIPEEIYKASQIIDAKCEATIQVPLEVIAKGTPLPKGHGRLIDAEALPLNAIDDANHGSNYIRIASTIIEADKGE